MWNFAPLIAILDLGGPVVATLGLVSVLTLAVILYKIWQFSASGVGRHQQLRASLNLWDQGQRAAALAKIATAPSYAAPLLEQAMQSPHGPNLGARLEAEADARFAILERGFRLLDSVAQLAPLLGLFGTVLGMIEAFQALQDAGTSVDPSLLAGGIWVALLTTAVGLGVAMPTSLILSWLDSRMEAERVLMQQAFTTILSPTHAASAEASHAA